MIEFDVETTSLQHHGGKPGEVFLTQFLLPDEEEPTLIYAHDAPGEPSTHPNPDIQDCLSLPEGYRAWNAKFDLHYLSQMGYDLPPDDQWHDGMVAAHIVDERFSAALQARGDRLFPEDSGKETEAALHEWLGGERARRRKESKDTGVEFELPNYGDVPNEIMEPYAAHDVTLQRRICAEYYPKIEASEKFKSLYAMEMDVFRAMFYAEERGIPFDREALVNMEAELLPNIEQRHQATCDIAGDEDFNPGSPKQIGEALERLGADVTQMDRSGKTKQLVTDEENLEACDHPLAAAVLAFRGETKMYSFLRAILHGPTGKKGELFPSPYIDKDDLVHPNFRQLGARTGRMSCADPNFQQVPRDDLRLRYAVRAEPGKKLVCCDLDSIELVLLAAFVGPGAMKDAILNPDIDPHSLTAERLGLVGRTRGSGAFEGPRDQGKRMNYLVVYGGGQRAIRKWFGVGRERAQQIQRLMGEAYPEIASLQSRIDLTLEERGFLQSPLTGRRWRMYGTGYGALQRESYKFLNYLIQGTAADVLKIAVARIHKAGVPIIAAVHDEVIAHVDAAEAREVAHIIEEAMTTGFEAITEKSGVSITAEAQIVNRWSDAKQKKGQPLYVPGYAQ